MSDIIFDEIKTAFLNNFEECDVLNTTTDIRVEFKHETDAEWFEKNICYPESLDEKEYPVHFISSFGPMANSKNSEGEVYSITFDVNDKDKLVTMLNNK